MRALLATLLLTCSLPATADIVRENSMRKWMCWTEGEIVSCGGCERGTSRYTREVCSEGLRSILATDIYQAYVTYYREKLEEAEDRVVAALVRVDEAEIKLLEFIDGAAQDPVRDDVRQAISSKRDDIAAETLRRNELARQVQLLERELAVRPTPDLVAQLTVSRAELETSAKALSTLQSEMRELHQTYITANSALIDEVVYRGVRAQRSTAMRDWDWAARDSETALISSADAIRIIKMVQDSSYVYEHIERNYPETNPEATQFGDMFGNMRAIGE